MLKMGQMVVEVTRQAELITALVEDNNAKLERLDKLRESTMYEWATTIRDIIQNKDELYK